MRDVLARAFPALTSRAAVARERRRDAFLARISELLDDAGDPLAALERLTAAAIPEQADLCIVDLLEPDGTLTAPAASGARPGDAAALLTARRHSPIDAGGEHPVVRVLRSGEPILLPRMTDSELERFAADAEHLALMRRLRYQSSVVVPLRARGRTIGTVSLLRYAGASAYDEHDLTLIREFARRAGVAIDHARLFGRVERSEADLRAVLESMPDAVVVTDGQGRLVYANRVADELGAQTLIPDKPAVDPVLVEDTTATGDRRWRLVRSSPVLDDAGRHRLVVHVVEDVTATQRAEFDQRFLATASKLLASSLDVTETLDEIAAAAVPALGDWCAVDMPDERGVLRRVATADTAPERRTRAALVVQERSGEPELLVGPPRVMRTAQPDFYPELTDDVLRLAASSDAQLAELRAVGARSALCVPMLAGERVTGTITLGTAESGRRLREPDLRLAEELGRRAGIAVDHARIHGERSTIAATLQEALLPPRLPVVPGLAIAARFRAAGSASTVGGDFYDLFAVGDAWIVTMGDVTGKGPMAAATTSLARYTMRTAANFERSPGKILSRLNDALLADVDRHQLCSAVCARVEARAGTVGVTVACGGHPPPLLARADGPLAPGTLLGAIAEGEWRETRVVLEACDALVLFTDGVTDTTNASERFGPERLEEIVAALAGSPADAIAGGVDDALLAFQEGEQSDDVALLVLQASTESETALAAAAPSREAAREAG